MRFIDWFAGIGGFRKGMEQAGHKCVGFCEYDKFAVMSYTSMHLITDEQRAYLSTLDMKQRQKEILKEEYRNGEWYADDIRTVDAGSIPAADCWCFGFPCQDISVSGKQLGFTGNRSSLFFRVMYLLGQIPEEKRPHTLFIENVKNLLSVNGGWDFARLLIEMDRGGYDAEWQVLNSKYFGVPQNRERCFIIGHLRGRSTAEVFPVEGTNRANNLEQIAQIYGTEVEHNPMAGRVYSVSKLSPSLDTCQGGNRMPKIATHCIDISCQGLDGKARVYTEYVPTLKSRDYKDPRCITIPVGNTNPSWTGMNGNCYYSEGLNPSLTINKNEGNRIAIPVLTSDRAEKRQNGRRFKEDGEPAFTLTGQDRHGVAVEVKPDKEGEIWQTH